MRGDVNQMLNVYTIDNQYVIKEHPEYGTFYCIKHALNRCLQLGSIEVHLDRNLGTFQWDGMYWVLQ
jgi:hypothetical protein